LKNKKKIFFYLSVISSTTLRSAGGAYGVAGSSTTGGGGGGGGVTTNWPELSMVAAGCFPQPTAAFFLDLGGAVADGTDAEDTAGLFEPAALGFAAGRGPFVFGGAIAVEFGAVLVRGAAKTCRRSGAVVGFAAAAAALDFRGNWAAAAVGGPAGTGGVWESPGAASMAGIRPAAAGTVERGWGIGNDSDGWSARAWPVIRYGTSQVMYIYITDRIFYSML
jgi:hypothetical protein